MLPRMTLVRLPDGTSRSVHNPRREKRKRGAGRFAEIKVGDQIMQRVVSRWDTVALDDRAANDAAWIKHERDHGFSYAIVTDLWFDPVKGETDPVAGQMVAVQHLRQGKPVMSKRAHTVRGLASNGFVYADRDEIAHWEAVRAAHEAGQVVGISLGRVIRKRPKNPEPIPL